ncbi:MAG: hypothetical protein FWE99_04025 [Bacteroidales bacterium]|nr:hypothetical protein [Bacteroidales bacterium]
MKAQFPKDQIIFEFKGLWDLPSKCGLRIWKQGERPILMVSELYKDNPGTSIAQVSASLCMQICRAYDLDYSRVIYIEHNPDMQSKLSFYDEELFLVHFETDGAGLQNPSWERLSPKQLHSLFDTPKR